MGRERFLKLLKEFDDNYILGEIALESFEKEAKENNQTLKQFMSGSDNMPIQWYSQINYNRIKQITQEHDESENKGNAFTPFYCLGDEKLDSFFHTLHKTKLFLTYFEEYNLNNHRDYKSRESLIKKYNTIIEDLKGIKEDDKTISSLETRMKSLKSQPILTKRRIYENLLLFIYVVLTKNKERPFRLTDKIANITNKIIVEYFGENENDNRLQFSRKTDINRLVEHTYKFETMKPISIWHSHGQ